MGSVETSPLFDSSKRVSETERSNSLRTLRYRTPGAESPPMGNDQEPCPIPSDLFESLHGDDEKSSIQTDNLQGERIRDDFHHTDCLSQFFSVINGLKSSVENRYRLISAI